VCTRVYSVAVAKALKPRRPLRPADLRAIDQRVDALDVEPVVYKLIHPGAGEEVLSLAQADQTVGLYRCFLKLCAMFPETPIVPTEGIDRVWHANMLDTAKYRTDCQLVFGQFLDHFPYAGLRGEADKLAWLEDFARTRRLFSDYFGIELGSDAAASVCRRHVAGADCCVGGATSAADQARPRPRRQEVGVGHVD
jgi:hypothetical protein